MNNFRPNIFPGEQAFTPIPPEQIAPDTLLVRGPLQDIHDASPLPYESTAEFPRTFEDAPPLNIVKANGPTEDPDYRSPETAGSSHFSAQDQRALKGLEDNLAAAQQKPVNPPPTWPPRGPEGASPEDGRGFLKPLPPEIAEGVDELRINIVDVQAETPVFGEEEITELLHTNPALKAAYPKAAVSETFQQERPNIEFTAPRISEGKIRSLALTPDHQQEAERAIDYAHTSGLSLTKITSPEALAKWIVKIEQDLRGDVSSHFFEWLLSDAFSGYLKNLELQRLTQNPDGKLVRYTTTPQLDIPGGAVLDPGILPSAEDHSRIPHDAIHPSLRPVAEVGYLTSWYRREPSSNEVGAYGHEYTRVETTVGELERGHQLALDGSRAMSLLAFRTGYKS
jgi:hypothetical protein